MSSRVWKISCVVALAATGGCPKPMPQGTPGEPSLEECLEPPAVPAPPGLAPGDPHSQGEMLGIGFKYKERFVGVDGLMLTGWNASKPPIEDIRVVEHTLQGKRHDEQVVGEGWRNASIGAVMHCTDGKRTRAVTLTVRGAGQRATAATIGPTEKQGMSWFFDLEIDLRDGSRPRNACGDHSGGKDVVFALPGHWEQGRYVASATEFSFACLSVGAALCLHRGYADDPTQLNGHPDLFQACGRLMRADYCGKGASYTREGTLIKLWDATETLGPAPAPYVFEGAWTADGMRCRNHPRWPDNRPLVPNKPACFDAIPECKDPATVTERPLLFSSSCWPEPCVKTP